MQLGTEIDDFFSGCVELCSVFVGITFES